MSDQQNTGMPPEENPSPPGVPPVEQVPQHPDAPPYAPAKEARETYKAMTQEEEEAQQKAELAKTQSHQNTQSQAPGPVETRSGSNELAPKADTSAGATHGRNRVSEHKAE